MKDRPPLRVPWSALPDRIRKVSTSDDDLVYWHDGTCWRASWSVPRKRPEWRWNDALLAWREA